MRGEEEETNKTLCVSIAPQLSKNTSVQYVNNQVGYKHGAGVQSGLLLIPLMPLDAIMGSYQNQQSGAVMNISLCFKCFAHAAGNCCRQFVTHLPLAFGLNSSSIQNSMLTDNKTIINLESCIALFIKSIQIRYLHDFC